ncbi:amino acid adenylation domain-containing protein [Micromonospora sp. ANENR4]|uniref:non-ribosomal peptide synthetase n=1 Tax=unclassified Micromonospora TaxID=2617518 RepID=UPI00188EBE72|nr:non-ribosomal peptide synthetase [Micromonospora sp. WMMC273]MBF5033661.1 amino acid adenylation domain-containing protein [Micromonospora sp. ANENR4]MCZ7476264.1 non-ribosomal peptide synthetase [Micromonospora sp. WMMC273]
MTETLPRADLPSAPFPRHLDRPEHGDGAVPATVVERFERLAAEQPDALAIVDGDERVTYGELNTRANRLARALADRGIGPESRVALLLRRGVPLITALWAVLKAGGVYVPLDRNLPLLRLRQMLDDARPALILDEEDQILPSADSRPVLTLADLGPGAYDDRHLDVINHPDSLAYVIFTSGSTGQPKGAAITHGGLANYLTAIGAVLGDTGGRDGAPLHSPLSFDLTVTALFLPLTTGRPLWVVPEENTLDHLADLLVRSDLDFQVVKLTPTHFEALLPRVVGRGPVDSVRSFVVGGEVLSPESVRDWRRLAPHALIVNEYGPTETVVGAVVSAVDDPGELVPIGRPLANYTAHVLTDNLEPVARGEAGELYLGGAGVARGYLHQPGLTAERFVPDPFATRPGARLYRTGDIARSRPDGVLDFLNRVDEQVKIRGYRIELGDIRSALLAHPAVADAVAVMRERNRDKAIVAYHVVAPGTEPPTPADLALWAAERLPTYMVPSAFVAIDDVPMNHNGKVDRRALPEPPDPAEPAEPSYTAPRTAAERTVADLWSTALGVRTVGIHDDFFDLGGHSLLASQIVMACADAFPQLPEHIMLRDMFRYPTVAGFAATLDEGLAQVATQDQPAAAPETTGTVDGGDPTDGSPRLPLAQERLWFLDQLNPRSPEYLIPMALRITGPLDVEALRAALTAVVERHEVLRTRFEVRDSVPARVLCPAADFRLEARTVAEDAIAAEVAAEAERPITLEAQLPLRAVLLACGPQLHVLCLTAHHIAFDGWSHRILLEELAGAYEAFTSGRAPGWPALPGQYAEIALRQDAQLSGATLERKIDFWRQSLAGSVATEVPPDHPRPPRRSTCGDTRLAQLPAELTDRMTALARRHGATPFMLLLAASQALLARYGGQSDVTVGTTVAERARPETADLIGLFVNILVLRNDLSGDPTFTDLLKRTRDRAVEAYAHQDVPFDHLVRIMEPTRDLSRTPLFNILVKYNSAPTVPARLPGLGVEVLPTPDEVSKYDLMLNFDLTDEGLEYGVQFDTALYDAPTIERFMTQLRAVVEQVVADPGVRLSMLSYGDAEPCLRGPDAPLDLATLLHEGIRAQARRTPDAVAVSGPDRALSYAELDRHAALVAARLLDSGVAGDEPVVLCMDRSVDMVAGLLGILHAGAAYLPIETDTPKARIVQIVADSGARVAVVDPGVADTFIGTGCGVVSPAALEPLGDLDEVAAVAGAAERGSLGEARSLGLCSVYYTSGSTGRPKGVASSHRGWLNRMAWMQRHHPLAVGDAVLHKTTLTFDDAAVEILWPLLTGGRVALLPPRLHLDPQAIIDAVIASEAVHVQFVPSVLDLFLQAVTPEDVAAMCRLRSVLSSGEALRPRLVRRFHEVFGDRVTLDNTWGATEVSIDSTCHVCVAADGVGTAGSVAIGTPFDHNEVWVLDENLRPVPDGAPGELWIGGLGLARGYLNNPAMTAAAFVPHPTRPGERLYRTGDWGRRRADDELMFLERRDDQVKIRGVRTELGEVTAALLGCAGVADAVVIAWEAVPGDKRLAAYVVLRPDAPPTAAMIREQLCSVLPPYAVPTSIHVLAALPRLGNGKLDRQQLPPPQAGGPLTPDESAPLANPTQEVVGRIWAEVLGIERIGPDDDFFAMGGHSLLVTRAVMRMRGAFELHVPIGMMFERPTVASASSWVEEAILAEIEAMTEDEATRRAS